MVSVDQPLEEDLPAFEGRLADAMTRACAMTGDPDSVAQLSWDSLAERLLAGMGMGMGSSLANHREDLT